MNEQLATPVTHAERNAPQSVSVSTGTVKENILFRFVSVYIQVNIIQLSAYPLFDL